MPLFASPHYDRDALLIDEFRPATPPYRCVWCGAPSWREPGEQPQPPDYCHEGDHDDPDR